MWRRRRPRCGRARGPGRSAPRSRERGRSRPRRLPLPCDGMIPPVVDMDWVRANPGAVLADVRWDLARGPLREEYEAGHLPGAVFVDLDADLSAPASPE